MKDKAAVAAEVGVEVVGEDDLGPVLDRVRVREDAKDEVENLVKKREKKWK